MLVRIFTVILFGTTIFSALGQDIESRITTFSMRGNLNSHSLSLFENGLVLNSKTEDKKTLRWDFFDNNLNHIETLTKPISKKMGSKMVFTNQNCKYHLFSTSSKNLLFKTDISSRYITEINFDLDSKKGISDMHVSNNSGFIITSDKKSKLHLLDLESNKSKKLSIFDKRTEKELGAFSLVGTTKDNETMLVTAVGKVKKGLRPMHLVSYDLSGNFKKMISLSDEAKKNLLNASVFELQGQDNYLVCGEFSNQQNSKLRYLLMFYCFYYPPFYVRQVQDQADGYYVREIKNGKSDYISYIPFNKLTHFADHLDKQAKARFEKAKLKNKDYYINTDMHEPVKLKDGILISGEIYTPLVSSSTSSTYDTNTNSYTHTTTNEVTGVRYESVFFIKIDNSGEIAWDISLPLELGYNPKYIKEQSTVRVDEKGKVLFTINTADGLDIYSLGSDGATTRTTSLNNVHKVEGELIKKETNVLPWYDNNALVYGRQYFEKENKKGKKVEGSNIFMSKIQLN